MSSQVTIMSLRKPQIMVVRQPKMQSISLLLVNESFLLLKFFSSAIMIYPLICTNNTQGHVDYGIPIVSNKSTDYRTAYGTYHGHIPPKGQDFDARVPIRGLKQHIKTEWNIKDINYNTVYNSEYFAKLSGSEPNDFSPNPLPYETTHYLKNEQERFYKNPPPPIAPKLSEMKDSYPQYVIPCEYREVRPPNPYAMCEIKGLGRDEQPPMRPHEHGYYKLLDPYLTTNRATHINFTDNDRRGIGEKDIITFYIGKGYKPINAPPTEPLVPRKQDPVTDKLVFKQYIPLKIVRKQPLKTLQGGKKSVYQKDYVHQSFSDMSPYLFQNGVELPESLSEASPWQTLCPPAMYCSEYCHTGTGWPVNSVVDPGNTEYKYIVPPCGIKFKDWMD